MPSQCLPLAVFLLPVQGPWPFEFPFVADGHRGRFAAAANRADGVIRLPGRRHEAVEKPSEIFAGAGFERGPQVFGCGMFEFPGIEVGLHAPVKPLGAETVTQVIESGGRFFVDHRTVVDGAEVVGVALHRLVNGHPGAQEIGEHLPALVRFPNKVEALHEWRGAVFKTGQPELIAVFLYEVPSFVEGVDALVHPRVGAFVASEDAVKPVVAHLVDDNGL